MKLNPDCIRDILLTVEDNSAFDHQTEYRRGLTNFPSLTPYIHEEIAYHIRQCELAGLIYEVHYYDGGDAIDILDLTPSGHEFLANVHSDTIWNNVKEVSTKVGSKSLNALTQIATGVITQLIKSQLGLT